MKKKLQVFVSSTFIDLKEERQAAVEAILSSKHIPAGMELFTAGNESQLTTIKKWIDESDVYMLILGGRYGSIEGKSGKSYTQIEYEYAVKKGMPVFTVILSQKFLHRKKSEHPQEEIFETSHQLEYNEFKSLVMAKVIKEVDDCKDIKLVVKDTIIDFLDLYNLIGWIKSDSVENSLKLLNENKDLAKENLKLAKELQNMKDQRKTNNDNMIGNFLFDDIVKALKEKIFKVPGKYMTKSKMDSEVNAYSLFIQVYNELVNGVTNSVNDSELSNYIYYNNAPFYSAYGLVEIKKVSSVRWQRIQITNAGLKFYAILGLRGVKKIE
jgi:hypothetical protein